MPAMLKNRRVLWIDNDVQYVHVFAEALQDEGYEILTAETITDAKKTLKSTDVDLVLVDIMIPVVSAEEEEEYSPLDTEGGFQTGLLLGRWINKNYPQLPVVGVTVRLDSTIRDRFMRFGTGFLRKSELIDPSALLQYVDKFLSGSAAPRKLRMFIVHGHDDAAKYELKNFLQNSLNLGEPIILHERPSLGRTVIEKFEDEAAKVDVVFVLLTPDDTVVNSSTPDTVKRRARQNVILELGYFLAKLERKKGRVLLLYRGELELPSDISGLIYIDISNGIESASEFIRRELADLF